MEPWKEEYQGFFLSCDFYYFIEPTFGKGLVRVQMPINLQKESSIVFPRLRHVCPVAA